MRLPRVLSFLCVAVLVAGVIAAVAHDGSRRSNRSSPSAEEAVPPAGALSERPGIASATGGTTPARAARATRATSSRPAPRAARPTNSPGPTAPNAPRTYPGTVTCNDTEIPAGTPYAWTCTHSDGTPVRWATGTVRVWVEGISSLQRSALEGAQAKWTLHSGIALVRVTSSSAADLVISKVDTLGALPRLGADILEYAITRTRYSGGYYDHATIEVADIPALGYNDWLDTFLHELGHVSGLDHVASPAEVMRPLVGVAQTGYGAGDIAGLESERPR